MLQAVKHRCKKFRIVLVFYECNWHFSVQRCVSGMTAVICTYPLDVVRARLAFQVTGDHRYTGIANAFHTIYLKVARVRCPARRWIVSVDLFSKSTFFPWLQEGGVLGFYRGLTPTLIGMAPYAGKISGFGGCNLLKKKNSKSQCWRRSRLSTLQDCRSSPSARWRVSASNISRSCWVVRLQTIPTSWS